MPQFAWNFWLLSVSTRIFSLHIFIFVATNLNDFDLSVNEPYYFPG